LLDINKIVTLETMDSDDCKKQQKQSRDVDTSALASQSMSVDQMMRVLLKDRVVECNSPKNRLKLYKQLKQNNIRYHATIIGYTSGKKNVSYWSENRWTVSKMAKWITDKRLTKDLMKQAYDYANYNRKEQGQQEYTFSDIEGIFDTKDKQEIKRIITTLYDEDILSYDRGHPFNAHLCIYKTIVRITLC